MATFHCSACDTGLDRIVRYCPECGARFPVTFSFADQDTEPFTIVRRRRSAATRHPRLVSLLILLFGGVAIAIIAVSTRPTFSAGNNPPSSPTTEPTATPDAIVSVQSLVLQATPSPTAAPSSTPTVEPTATATMIRTETSTPRPAPTSTRTATPTAIVTPNDVVENGGFEEGDRGWYLENGARVAGVDAQSGHDALILPAAGAYADQIVAVVPGARYELSVWAMLGAAGDSAEIGIRFADADGRRLTDLEPHALSFTETDYAQGTLVFTVPEDVSEVRVTIWKPSGRGILAVDEVSLRGVVTGESE
jgi:hypothetical protein